jgi:NADPH2:quinone reductase
MAHAIRLSEYGDPEVLEHVEIDAPTAGAGDVVIEVRAAGVNPVDYKTRQGKRSTEPLTRWIGLGSDASGVIIEVGAGVTGWDVGDEVIAHGLSGAYATHVAASVDRLVHKAPAVSFERGAAMGVPAGTAYQVLSSLRLASGQTLLVHAGAGAVGLAGIQFGALWGATVIATASAKNHERIAELGAIPVA